VKRGRVTPADEAVRPVLRRHREKFISLWIAVKPALFDGGSSLAASRDCTLSELTQGDVGLNLGWLWWNRAEARVRTVRRS